MATQDSKAVPDTIQNLIGKTYGRLTVIGYAGKRPRMSYWHCECECGNKKTVRGEHLKNGKIVSCGCYRLELNTIHGHARDSGHTKIYQAWINMNARCSNPDHPSYEHYGGRGITVFKEWRESFEAFLADVGRAPSKDLTLERIDNDKGYEPGNVKWATFKEQSRNTRRNVMLTHDGKTMTLTDWAKHLGVPRDRIRGRLRMGWSVEKALTTPRLKSRWHSY